MVEISATEFAKKCGRIKGSRSTGADCHHELSADEWNMPSEMDGYAVANWLQPYWPTIPGLRTSGVAKLVIGADGRHRRFVSKPFAMPEVERRIRELLHKGPSLRVEREYARRGQRKDGRSGRSSRGAYFPIRTQHPQRDDAGKSRGKALNSK